MEDYTDPRIEVSAEGLRIRRYYFPSGDKRVPFAAIRAVRRVEVGTLRGRWRIWGTANPHYWTNFDPGRPRKKKGFLLDLGERVQPFLTPDDPATFEASLVAHTDAPFEDSNGALII